MIYTYAQSVEKYGSKYKVKKAIEDGLLFRIEKGVYSEQKYVSGEQIISMKYPHAVFTMNSAFYYHGLTDVIPDFYYLATEYSAAPITDKRVKQVFENSAPLMMGAIDMDNNGHKICVYSKERMLVELMRNKNKLPFDYYKEILLNYRRILDKLSISLIEDYAYDMPKSDMIMKGLRLEVF